MKLPTDEDASSYEEPLARLTVLWDRISELIDPAIRNMSFEVAEHHGAELDQLTAELNGIVSTLTREQLAAMLMFTAMYWRAHGRNSA
jgi:hypothetical protein